MTKKMTTAIIVDDDYDTVETLADCFEHEGICIVGCGYNGEEAFQLYKQHKPDIVILDMKMPEYDGVYAIDKIKKEDPNAKIIVLTAYMDYKFPVNEVVAIFSKPYEFDDLLAKVKELFH